MRHRAQFNQGLRRGQAARPARNNAGSHPTPERLRPLPYGPQAQIDLEDAFAPGANGAYKVVTSFS
jgi:hypothetical protein